MSSSSSSTCRTSIEAPDPPPPPPQNQLDADWIAIRTHLLACLDGKTPRASDVAVARAAATRLENDDKVSIRRSDGTQVHGVRVRLAKLVRAHVEQQVEEEESAFVDRWRTACQDTFTHHDQHYVQQRKAEKRAAASSSSSPFSPIPRSSSSKGDFPDDCTTTMYDLGIAVRRAAKRDDRDAQWSAVESFISASLEGKTTTIADAMGAYTSAYNIETSSRCGTVNGARSAGHDAGTGEHYVRIKVADLMRQHARQYPTAEAQLIADRWRKASTRIFPYHDRHFVARQREERRLRTLLASNSGVVPDDDGTKTMYEMGMAAWHAEADRRRRS